MSDFANLNGARIVSATVTVPYYGPWVADVTMSLDAPIPAAQAACTLTIGNLSMVGTVVRQAQFAGSTEARIVGGAGGWRKKVSAQHYQSGDLLLSMVVTDAAATVGERVVFEPGADTSIGADYVRGDQLAEDVIRQLHGPAWWVAPDGVTHIGARTPALVPTDFQALEWVGSAGRFTIATEDYAAWLPGATFTGPTIPSLIAVSSCMFTLDGDEGTIRLDVLATDPDQVDRLISPIDTVIRTAFPRDLYGQICEYSVQAATGTPPNVYVDIAPSSGLPLPTMRNIRIMPDASGSVCVPQLGATCLVAFANRDPTKPRVISIDAVASVVGIDAALPGLVQIGRSALSVQVGAIPTPVAHSIPTLGIVAALVTLTGVLDTFAGTVGALATAIVAGCAPAIAPPGPPSFVGVFVPAVPGPAGTAATDAAALATACTATIAAIAALTPEVPTIVLEAT